MQITFGEHKGKSAEMIVLREPQYVHWILNQKATGPLAVLKVTVQKLISVLDKKTYQKPCMGKGCDSPAIGFSVYGENLSPHWWCASCNPYQLGANEGKLSFITTYERALDYVKFFCKGRKGDFKALIKTMTLAKGLPVRLSYQQAVGFFQTKSSLAKLLDGDS
jgi:hypothetical protein